MKLNVIIRDDSIYSEVWLHRQLSYSFIDKIFCIETPNIKTGRENVFYLNNSKSTFQRILRKLKLISEDGIQVKRIKKLQRNIKKGDILLFHYADVAMKFKSLIKTDDYKVFVYCHGYDMVDDLRTHESPQRRYHPENYGQLMKDLSHHVSFIVNSEYSRGLLHKMGINADKIFLNFYGVPAPIARTTGSDGMFKILYVGRLVDFKGPDRVLQAFDLATKLGLNAEMIFAGDGPLRVTLELMRQRSPNKEKVKILGAVDKDKVEVLMKEADIFTVHNCIGELTRQGEAFGVSIVEAMNVGLPVVGTKSGGPLESVVNGETGIMVNPFDIESQANAFLRLYHDPDLRQRLSENSVKWVRKRFSKEAEIENLKKILFS